MGTRIGDFFFISTNNLKPKSLFLRFLAKHGIIEEFLNYLVDANKKTFGTKRDFLIKNYNLLPVKDPDLYINNCFPWEKTIRGSGFWSDLQGSWRSEWACFKYSKIK